MRRFLSIVTVLIAVAIPPSCMNNGSETEQAVLSVDILEDNLALVQGENYQLTLVMEPSGTEYLPAEWESLDPEIASVSQEGVVSAESEGMALIKVTVCGFSATSIVTVNKRQIESIGFVESEYEIHVGETLSVEVALSPSWADISGSVWTSTDSSVVMPVAPGEFMGLSVGEAFVTVRVGGKSANCKIKVLQGPVSSGDFLFDDGSVCSTLLPGKYPVAVVVYTGDPTVDDKALRAEYPSCTHGLAVSISEDLLSAWQPACQVYGKSVGEWCDLNSEYSSPLTGSELKDNLNKICGYNNTMALMDFNSDFANHAWKVTVAVEFCYYAGEWLAPEGTSGWYIPSAKEMSLLVRGVYEGSIWDIQDADASNLEIVNTSISQVRPDGVIDKTSYWTSSEYDESYAYFVNVTDGRAGVAPKSFENGALRFIVAF